MLLAGCSSETSSEIPVHPAQGTVLFKGKPAAGAMVALHPRKGGSANAPNPRGTVQADGSLQLTTYQKDDGAPEGEYTITVEWSPAVKQNGDTVPGPNVLPPKYATPSSSDLTVAISPGTNQLPKIDLK